MLLKLDEPTSGVLRQVRRAMETYFGPDQRRIDHALQVTEYAEEFLSHIDADPLVTLCAAYLHDIGIPEAERKHGHCSGKQQEIEGPPVARMLLQDLAVDSVRVDTICCLIGNHHTPRGVDSPEFRILWDADALVNLAEVVDGLQPARVEEILRRSLVTEAGYRRAREIYL